MSSKVRLVKIEKGQGDNAEPSQMQELAGFELSSDWCGWFVPAFVDSGLEAAFRATQLKRLPSWRVAAAHFLLSILLLPLFCFGRALVQVLSKQSEAASRCPDCLSPVVLYLVLAVFPATCWMILSKVRLDFVPFVYALLTVAVFGLAAGCLAAGFIALGIAVVCSFIQLVQLPATHCLVLVHLIGIFHIVLPAYPGDSLAVSLEEGLSGTWASGHTVSHALTTWCMYLFGLAMYCSKRGEEFHQRSLFAAAKGLEAQPAMKRDIKVTPRSLLAPAKQQQAVSHGSSPPRDLTVPPPPPCPDGPSRLKEGRAPNPILVRAMAGRNSDWVRIRCMATRIREPQYGLRSFFDDCIFSFPELSLFFERTSFKLPRSVRQTSSGMSGEAEYQRTIGALFTVYWMLRLDGDGVPGCCYGVDESWLPIPVQPPVHDKPFGSMTPEEKRAQFAATMDWQLFTDLVARSGCAPSSPGSVERIMALLCLSAFHDIMKLPMLQPVVQPEHAPYHGYDAGVRIHDHDLALSYVLECFPDLLPSYAGLPEKGKRGVLFTQGKMQFNHGWFVQGEAPPGGMLSKFKAVLMAGAEQADIDLYFLHWITDFAGAEATPLGGAEKLVMKFPHAVLRSFLWSMTYLSMLAEVSETALVEQYLEARWQVICPDEALPDAPSSIAIMRLALMAQAADSSSVMRAFESLPAKDRTCLATELARTGCEGQTYKTALVCGGPAFLVYYSPALLQRNNDSQKRLKVALHILTVVLRGARALWPMSLKQESNTVIIQIDELKSRDSDAIINEPKGIWILVRNNNNEGSVQLQTPAAVNALYMEGANFRLLDFALVDGEDPGKPQAEASAQRSLPAPMPATEAVATQAFESGIRILVFTDMSTECDDECALLWLVEALHRRDTPATVELVQTDSHVRFQWMAHVFADKFAPGGEWKVQVGGNSFYSKNVLVNMYMAHSPDREDMVINDIEKKAPHVKLDIQEIGGRKVAKRSEGSIGGLDYMNIIGGPVNSIVVSAAIPNVEPEFFQRFSSCKCVYVVGTPGGINCPMPSWVDLLAAMHRLAPVVYLTPQLTRTVRFPRNYVAANMYWNETIKHTVWDNVLTCMARRPEMPAKFGNWGLLLRLNLANSNFCREWYAEALGKLVEDAERPEDIVTSVQSYVDRNSGDDRELGAVVEELRLIGVDVSKAALELPHSKTAKEVIRNAYRQELYEAVMVCVLTSDALLWKHKKNIKVGLDSGGFEKTQRRCGYVDPNNSLVDIFGPEEAVKLLKTLPLRKMTPAYDVIAMVVADSALEEGTDVDGGLDLLLEHADDTMGYGLLSPAQRSLSEHPVLYTLPQSGHGVYAVGPFV